VSFTGPWVQIPPSPPQTCYDKHSLELPVEELLSRARPLPAHDDMVIDDLTEEEGEAFLAALEA
jgi:hypothetical protein